MYFELLTRQLNLFCFTFQLLSRSWKTKNDTSSYSLDGYKIKHFISSYSMGVTLFSHIQVTNMKLINEKISLNITVSMLVNSQKSILLLRFLRTCYNSMYQGCPGILKSSSGIDVVSNRWQSIISLFRDYIPFGSRDI